MSKRMLIKRVPLPWISVTINDIEVFEAWDWGRSLMIGSGLVYYDGENLLKPDLVDLMGNPLPGDTFYSIVIKGEPVLAVLAMSVQ